MSLRTLTTGTELRAVVRAAQHAGHTVGLVPTMGALHEGHLSLIDAARRECDLVVATVFVNPTQFGPNDDLGKYPRDVSRDLALLAERRCDIVFTPAVEEMYPPGFGTTIDVGVVAGPLDGEFRPGHFRGVATVVMKLFQLAPADRAYFGQKDYQQSLVVRQLVRDLNVPIEIRVCPTVREPDGLALSSRNAYLSAGDRRRAVALSESLRLAEKLHRAGERDPQAIETAMRQHLAAAGGVEVQYIALLRDGTVEPVTRIDGPTVVAIAAIVGGTRLIDNVRLELSDER
ncbi:MAG: pantoate--beta-alanine ligase [Pirellulales bacterium]